MAIRAATVVAVNTATATLISRNSSALRAASLSFKVPPFPQGPTIRITRPYSCPRATMDEASAAKEAAASANSAAPTIFDKIIAKEIPSTIVYEDEKVLAFRDVNPQAPVHILLIPKARDGLTQLSKAEFRHSEILGDLLYTAKLVAEKEGLKDGFRVVINDGLDGCQSVYHLHLHLLGGRQLKWPPG
ncbi:14 kDa zinc-binding protein isoform X1 [Amborella trichopoda]|uniref:14 kDa zinc-binding protein isoform X1 n=1 Tax=Amborella trichopoda TaxID=13333 RepID=UPI0009BD71A1|nr:14 kDa zinc-binding protein isoform X1 [Amborella trichopoda]|eukprot:XP_020531619.1 14 kDa zinc-binding protein isoform X1 [Amborella trichopoda]